MSAAQELFDVGLAMRKKVLGEEYVARSMDDVDEYTAAIQRLVTEWCWGYAWGREDALPIRTRSLINLALLTALGKTTELTLHVRGAINNGVAVDEIRETLLHATIYCGVPAGLEAFRASHAVLTELGVLGARDGEDSEDQ